MLQGGVPDANETTDYTDATDVRLGSARASRADWKAWPLLRIRCSSGVAETSAHREAVGIFPRSTVKLESPIAAESWAAINIPLSHNVCAGRVRSGRSPVHPAAAYPPALISLDECVIITKLQCLASQNFCREDSNRFYRF
jgi:hypothetical protein